MARRPKNGETGTPEPGSPLQDVFPGETVVLSDGRSITVTPWGFHALVHEVPALLGGLMAKLAPLQQALRGQGAETILPIVLSRAAAEVADLVAWSCGIEREALDALKASDALKLTRAVVRQNRDFFGELQDLYADLRVEIGSSGTPSTSPSSAPASSPPTSDA